MAKVTLYIVNHNYGRFLKQSVCSALNQSYRDLEIILIDDGSTDDSHVVLDSYEQDERVVIVRQNNLGLLGAIGTAFEMATGEYVVRLDADDWLDEACVEKLVAEMDRDDDIAMVFPDYYEVDEYGNVMHQIKRHDFSSGVTVLDQPAHGACTLIRKKYYTEAGGHDDTIACQDGVDIWLALTEKYSVSNVSEPLFFYRKHSDSLSSDDRRLLGTRANIYRRHAMRRGFRSEPTIAIIPVRERLVGERNYAFIEIGQKKIIDRVIEKAIDADEVDQVAVVTESQDIIQWVESRYAHCKEKNIKGYRRDPSLAASGVDIMKTIEAFLKGQEQQFEYAVLLTLDFPFSNGKYIDTAIYSMFLFDCDSVDSVVLDNSIFYYHDGTGLKLWRDIKIRKERDNVYIRKGGITVFRTDKVISGESLVSDRMGHVIVDKTTAFEIHTADDVGIADYISRNLL